MGLGASHLEKSVVEKELTTMFDSKWLRTTASDTGLIKRERKIDPVIMFWALAIGYGAMLIRTLSGLKREYEVRGKIKVSDSSWNERFTEHAQYHVDIDLNQSNIVKL
jgi:putative transposase